MPCQNQPPCNYQDATWKAKLLQSPTPLLKMPFLTPLHKRLKSKCVLLEAPHHLALPSPWLRLSFLNAPKYLAVTAQEGQDRITHLPCVLETFTFKMSTCSFMELQWRINEVKIPSEQWVILLSISLLHPLQTVFFPWSKCVFFLPNPVQLGLHFLWLFSHVLKYNWSFLYATL